MKRKFGMDLSLRKSFPAKMRARKNAASKKPPDDRFDSPATGFDRCRQVLAVIPAFASHFFRFNRAAPLQCAGGVLLHDRRCAEAVSE